MSAVANAENNHHLDVDRGGRGAVDREEPVDLVAHARDELGGQQGLERLREVVDGDGDVHGLGHRGVVAGIDARGAHVVERADAALRAHEQRLLALAHATGAVVGQQPFGGSRASGTNDKAGSYLNLIRWTSQRTIKENFVPPKHFAYPFMGEE